MNVAIASLVALVVVIVVGFWRKMNVGLLAVLAAMLVGTIYGIPDKEIIGGFNGGLFMMLLGVSFMCAIGISNGSLELLANKSLRLAGGRVIFAPIIIYLIGAGIAAVGPGCVPALGIVAALSLPLGKTTGYNPVMLALIGEIGSFAGRFSPITPESAVIKEGVGSVSGYQGALITYAIITTIVISIVAFFYFKGFKVSGKMENQKELASFNWNQVATLLAFAVVIVASAFFKKDVGLISFSAGIVLVLINAVDEKAVFKTVSWSTLIMITGVGMLMNIVISNGGIDMLSKGLSGIMNTTTAVAIQGLVGAIMSWFSSAIGVVWPTLMPAVGGIAQEVGVAPQSLITILGLTAAFAGLSPASTGGGLIMAAYSTDPEFTKEKANKLFIELFAISGVTILLISLAALVGLYNIL
jgi:di/tricarboxylate transporter